MARQIQLENYFRGIHLRFSRLYAHFFTEVDLTLPQYALLNVLDEVGKISMCEVAEKLGITKPAVTYLVDQLERKRLLKRMPHAKDRRIHLLEIQAKGSALVEKAQGMMLGFMMGNLKAFNHKEKKTIGKFFETLSVRMDEVLTQ